MNFDKLFVSAPAWLSAPLKISKVAKRPGLLRQYSISKFFPVPPNIIPIFSAYLQRETKRETIELILKGSFQNFPGGNAFRRFNNDVTNVTLNLTELVAL